MSSKRDWEAYPSNYRAEEIKVLANWIRAGESGSVVGLAGAGKSNLIGFLSRRPEALTRYLKDRSLDLIVVLVDLNSLPGNDLATFYRVILRSLYEARGQLAAVEDALPGTVQDLYHKAEEQTDPFVLQSALREALFLFRDKGVGLVLMLDPFDYFCQAAATQVLDNLRGLRDSFKATLSYIVGLRHELIYVRDPAELGELYEILDTHVCWLGPMERDDANWVISQVEEGTGQSFDEEQVEWLIDITGSYPALLRAASLWLAKVPSRATAAQRHPWEKQLLAEPSIQNRLNDLWQGLTGEEQFVLTEMRAMQWKPGAGELQKSHEDVYREYSRVFARLQDKKICYIDEAARWQVFSPLLAAYIDQVGKDQVGGQTSSGKICWGPDNVIRKGNSVLDLSVQDRKLLRIFLDNPETLLEKDDIICALWSDEEIYAVDKGVTDWRFQQAISHLRRNLGQGKDSPCYIKTVRGVGYQFFPEGAPRG